MNTHSWESDQHGTLVLPGKVIGHEGGFAWIQPRRNYCDRGHWDWGTQGLPFYSDKVPTPSYYFMRLDNGLAEIESWLARQLGGQYQGRTIHELNNTVNFSYVPGQHMELSWQKQDNSMQAFFPGKEGQIVARLVEKNTDSGPVFIFDAQGIGTLDDSDRFPRAYMDLDRALDEIESFFAWRLLKIPTEIPHRFEEGTKPMGAVLSAVLDKTTPPVRRKIKP